MGWSQLKMPGPVFCPSPALAVWHSSSGIVVRLHEVSSQSSSIKWQVIPKYASVVMLVQVSIVNVIFDFAFLSLAFTSSKVVSYFFSIRPVK